MSLTTFFAERTDIAALLEKAVEPSLLNVYQTDLPKIMIVAAASSFEKEVVKHIEDFYRQSATHESATIFVLKKALYRQYHQLFGWNDNNVNVFTNYFGPACSKNFKELLGLHEWLGSSMKDFLDIGRVRNELIHGDFASYSPSLTPTEVQTKYRSAERFVAAIPRIIRVEPLG
ncbi:hypothetical protein ABIB17_000757 [Arthrobacter sp. UYEF6]